MNFENPLFLIPVIVGPIFIILGFILSKYPPKKINLLYGYRTSSSMQDQFRWNFAQKYSAKELVKSGILLTLTSIVGLYYDPGELYSLILVLSIMIFVIGLLIVRVELAIKKKFVSKM